jgi:hypothetical protein
MFIYSLFQVMGYTGVENSIIFVCYDVKLELLTHESFF